MDDAKLSHINLNRLQGWHSKLNAEHATPVVMVACGHDEKAGTVNILVPEDISLSQVATILEGAAAGLRQGKLKLN